MKPSNRCDFTMSQPASITRDDIRLSTAGTVDADGLLWTSLAELDGAWTELIIDLDLPASWVVAPTGKLRAYAMEEGGNLLVGQWDLLALSGQAVGSRIYKRLRVTGQCARGFRVELGVVPRAVNDDRGLVTLLAHGDDSGPPGPSGEVLTLTNQSQPTRQAELFGLDPVSGRWYPADVTVTAGRASLNVTGTFGPAPGSRFIVAGDRTPVDGEATPTDALDVSSFGMLWNETGATWYFGRSDTEGFQYVQVTAFNAETPLITDAGHFVSVANNGNAFVIVGLPDPDATTPKNHASTKRISGATVADFAKAGRGCVVSVSASNESAAAGFYLCLVDKASAPSNGNAIVDAWWIPPNGVFALDLVHDYFLATGVAFCASSTCNTVTLLPTLVGIGCASVRWC